MPASDGPTGGTNGASDTPKPKRSRRRRSTAHLKAGSLRQRTTTGRIAGIVSRKTTRELDRETPLTKDEMEQLSRQLLERVAELPEGYVGWMMVNLADCLLGRTGRGNSAVLRRRLFLLPHCLKHAEGCPADYDEFGLDCERCGACSIADFRTKAEKMGYKVLVAEGSPIVMKIIVSGHVDAIVGCCLLERAGERRSTRFLLAGIPCMAVPLLVERLPKHVGRRRLGASDAGCPAG